MTALKSSVDHIVNPSYRPSLPYRVGIRLVQRHDVRWVRLQIGMASVAGVFRPGAALPCLIRHCFGSVGAKGSYLRVRSTVSLAEMDLALATMSAVFTFPSGGQNTWICCTV